MIDAIFSGKIMDQSTNTMVMPAEIQKTKGSKALDETVFSATDNLLDFFIKKIQ